MGKITLLDCTLRDGGYVNDWKFGIEAIEGTIEKLISTDIDILEVGFLKDETYLEDRTVFNSMKQISKLICPKQKGLKYAAMVEVVNPLPLDKLDQMDDDSVDIIRVIVWKRLLNEGFEYCKGIVEKGYKLCVQPARVDQYSEQEFIEMMELFKQLDPLAVYVVDSFGTQNKSSILKYINLADKHLPPNIAIGYHGHNNLMQAIGTAKAFVELGFEREIIIDASVYGMGRGAGNLNLELIAKYLNETKKKTYKIEPMLQIYDDYLKKIHAKYTWGYSLPFYLTALHKCNPEYASYYGLELQIPTNVINNVLNSISEEDKIIFSKAKAYEYYLNYREKSKKD